jgi:hypothetical protein
LGFCSQSEFVNCTWEDNRSNAGAHAFLFNAQVGPGL